MSPESGDRIIEIGCVEMLNRRLSGRNLHFYLNPQRPNSEDAVKVHGLTDEFLADKPLFEAVADELMVRPRLVGSTASRTLHRRFSEESGGVDCIECRAGKEQRTMTRMTRGRAALGLALPVILATADEAAAHDRLLADLDKASGGKTVWRALVA